MILFVYGAAVPLLMKGFSMTAGASRRHRQRRVHWDDGGRVGIRAPG